MAPHFRRLILCFASLLLCACAAADNPLVLPDFHITRSESIPENKIKVLPAVDEYTPVLHHNGWKEPTPLSDVINTAGLEDSPYITADGKTLFFFFTPDAEVPAEQQLDDGATGIYRSRMIDGVWTKPERIPLTKNGETALDGCPTFSGGTLWFCSIRKGNFRTIDFWQADWAGTEWMNLRNAGKQLNDLMGIGEMHISADGRSIFFHKSTHGNTNLDIFIINKYDDEWGDPVLVDSVNSGEDDSRPALSPDETELWFTRTHEGTPAIYRSIFSENAWGAPELVISKFAGEPAIDRDGNIYFTHHFFKDGKMIEADIYIAIKK